MIYRVMLNVLTVSVEGSEDEGDASSIEESEDAMGTEAESSPDSPAQSSPGRTDIPPDPETPKSSKASQAAASRGLNISVDHRGNRHSRIMGGIGLPSSPRPPASTTTYSPTGSQTAIAPKSPTDSNNTPRLP